MPPCPTASRPLRAVVPLRGIRPAPDTLTELAMTALAATHAPRPGNDAPFR
jgi:hypothetical protein